MVDNIVSGGALVTFKPLSFFCLISFSMVGVWASGQAGRPAATATPPDTLTRPGSIQDSGLYDYWTEMSNQGRAGGVLLGKLAMEGEPLPWEPIPVSVVCAGTILHRALSDPRGRFVITTAHVPGALSMQGDAQRQMETHFQGCTVQASLAGFRSNAITIAQRNFLNEPDLGTLTLFREGGREAGTAVSRTTESAPANATKLFEKARAEWLEQKSGHAQQDIEKAVKIYPQFADAWYQLGVLQETSDPNEARNSFSKASTADPQFVLPYERLAALFAQDEKWKDVVDNTSHALQLDPVGTPQIWYYAALANFQLGKTDAARNSATKSLAMDPQHSVPNNEQLLAVVLAQKKDYGGAVAHLRNCLTYLPAGPNADLIKQQIAKLEQLVSASK
jgi:tetratricopeptide (TPR) repeat protein